MVKYWYDESDDSMPSVVYNIVQGLRDRYVKKLSDVWKQAKANYAQSSKSDAQSIPITRSSSYNITRIAADTVATRMVVDKPTPKVLTSGAKEETQQDAKQLEHLIQGVLQNSKFDEQSYKTQLDGILTGIGWSKVFSDNKKIIIANVKPEDIILDPTQLDAMGMPYSIFQVAKLHPTEVEALYGVDIKNYKLGEGNVPYVEVIEGWRRQLGEEKGKHVICTESRNLITPEDYEYENFPLIPYKPEVASVGWWSTGMGVRLIPVQNALNFIDEIMQGGMERWSTPILILPNGVSSQEAEDMANPRAFQILQGEKPGWLQPPIVSPELLDIRDRIKQEGLMSVGVGPYQATGTKPAGLNSGIAIRNHYDIESQQISKYLSENEKYIVAVGNAILREAQYLSEIDSEWSVSYKGKSLFDVKWKDIKLDRDQYTLSVQATSALPYSFAGRVETVKDLANSGLIQDPKIIRQLLRMPDLDEWQNLEDAPRDALQLMLDDIMAGHEQLPSKFDDLETAMTLGLQYLAKAKVEKRGKKIILSLENWCEEINRLMSPPKPVEPPMPGPMPGPPMPMPNVPNILPNDLQPMPGGLMPQGGLPPMPPQGLPPMGPVGPAPTLPPLPLDENGNPLLPPEGM